MIQRHLKDRGITDKRVLRAFEAIPRHRFVPQGYLDQAYADYPLPIGMGQTISQPYIVALMLQELQVQPGQRILDVGAGSGYQTALLAAMAAKVFAVERVKSLANRAISVLDEIGMSGVPFLIGDGTNGWEENSPFDGIICGAAAPEVPEPWLEQLAEGGRIVLPLGNRYVQTLCCVTRDQDIVLYDEICGVRFVPLLGKYGWAETLTTI